MNIDAIRNKIYLYKGKKIRFRFNGSRNQNEEFIGIITDIYPSIFTIKLCDRDIIKSFSYSDVVIRKLIIDN